MINQQQRDEELWQVAKARARFKWSAMGYLLVNAFLVAIWFITSGPFSYFWPIWPMMGWGIGIAFQYFHAFHGNEISSTESEFEKLKRQEQHNKI